MHDDVSFRMKEVAIRCVESVVECGRVVQDGFSRSALMYPRESFSSGLLPILGLRSTSFIQSRKHIILPNDNRYRYLKTWFALDVAATIPIQALVWSRKHDSGLTYSWLNMLRLLRLRRVSTLFSRLEKDIRFNYFWMRCLRLLCDLLVIKDGIEQIVEIAKAGDVVGELGVVCFKPQPFTVRTRKLSQLMRIDRTNFINILNANVADGQTVGNNLFQHLKESSNGYICSIAAELEYTLAKGGSGVTMSLGFVASKGETHLMELLLAQGMDPNTLDSSQQTPLHIAAANGYLECVHLLLEHGADPNIRDEENSVSLSRAIFEQHEAVARLLWEHGAILPIEAQGDYLCAAAEKGDIELLQSLVNYGADVSVANSEGTTALQKAVEAGCTEVALLLLSYGARVDHRNQNGLTPIDFAKQGGQKDLIQLLENPPKHIISSSKSIQIRTPKRALNRGNEQTSWPWAGFKKLPNKRLSPYCARITIHQYHPGSPVSNTRAPKLLIPLPNTWDALIEYLSQKLGYLPVKVFNQDGAEINDISVIRDGDDLHIVGEEQLIKFQQHSNHPQTRREAKKWKEEGIMSAKDYPFKGL